MLNKTFQVFLFLSLVFSACEKSDDASERNMNISQIKVLQESNVGNAITVVAGDGVYLLLYSDLDGQYYAKLLTNDGVEIWTKNISSDMGFIASEESLIIEEVLYDIDGSFAFFSGTRLIRMDLQGEVVYDNPNFTSGIPDGVTNQARILNVFLTSDGGYLVSGSFLPNSNTSFRAYFSKYSRTGTVEFSELFFKNTGGHYGITDGFENEDGFTLGGYYSSVSSNNKTAYYILKISTEGETLLESIHEIDLPSGSSPDYEILGRELVKLENGNMMYFMVPQRVAFSDQRTKGFVLDEQGALVDSVFFDLGRLNALGGTRPSIGQGIVQTNNGDFKGLVNTEINAYEISDDLILPKFPTNYELPNHGYTFFMNSSGIIENMNYLDQSLSNKLSSIALLSNGNTLIFGKQQSIDFEFQLITILSEEI